MPTRYDKEFKQNIINLYKQGESAAQLAREYGIGYSTVHKWIQGQAKTQSGKSPDEIKAMEKLSLIHIFNRLAKRLNHEKSQSNNQKPVELWAKEKEHFRSLNSDLTRYFNSVQTRKVSRDSMIRFQNHQYSVSPNYIGKEVEIKPTTDGKTIRIFYQGVEIQKHDLTNKQFNYDLHDKRAILKSDLMEDKTDEEINQYMLNNLSIYDQIGD